MNRTFPRLSLHPLVILVAIMPLAACLAVCLAAGLVVSRLYAGEAAASGAAPAAAPGTAQFVVQLVTDLDAGTLASDTEQVEEIIETEYTADGSVDKKIGEQATLWVRNAHVDGRFFFERYYQEKFVGRSSRLEIPVADLPVGEHFIEPGHHRFVVAADGTISSADPDIRVAGRTVSLRLHRVEIMPVDATKAGPPEFRLMPAEFGLLSALPDWKLDPAALPDLKTTFDPRKPSAAAGVSPLADMLSRSGRFQSLGVWLPANTQGAGYVLVPSWQAFHVQPGGRVGVADQPRVPGIELGDSVVVVPYRQAAGRIRSRNALNAGVGAERLGPAMNLGPTLRPLEFVAGYEKPDPNLSIQIDPDASKMPNKFFVADNTAGDKEAIRLVAFEWNAPIYERGGEGVVSVRFRQSSDHPSLTQPEVRAEWSPYQPSNPMARSWQPVDVLDWQAGGDRGLLRFRVPDVPFQYAVFRLAVCDRGDTKPFPPLSAEIPSCIVDRGQRGSVSVVSNRGRNAFVAGEPISLQVVLRSAEPRPAGQRTILLTHPDGREDRLPFDDPGAAWWSQPCELPAMRTARLESGSYTITVADLPTGIAAMPWQFDIATAERPSLFHVVKPSKYTKAMNNLEPSHTSDRVPLIDLDRAVDTLSRLGYTRVDLMTYSTNHHLRGHAWRERLSEVDPRLPPPDAVYTPTPREQILNACVRHGMQYSDVWLSYNDFHLPRRIEPYIRASERWIARETQAMRHSPAFDGMMLYDEMYESAVSGLVPHHQKYFGATRVRLAEEKFGVPPSKIEQAFSRYLQRPPAQRDPAVLQQYIAHQDWQQHGWAEYIDRVVDVARGIAPAARFGTYHRTWMAPGTCDDIYNGYAPDLFRNLDIISHVHYADNITGWVHAPLMASILRTGRGKTLYLNMPLTHESSSDFDGQYTRQMALSVLSLGANGVAQYGLPHSFDDGPNPHTALANETTRVLNREILRPFGAINDHTTDGYRRVGIVSTLAQHATSRFKPIAVSCQTEGIAVACWRLGYPATFLREDTLQEPLDGFEVIFVPGIHFEGELSESVMQRLRAAVDQGIKVVVEGDSQLQLPGVMKLADWKLDSYYIGDTYFATWEDDELNKVYRASQPIVDYLRPKLTEWGVEPAARGDFRVGPNWRSGGDIQYLIHANFDDPPYRHSVKQSQVLPKVQRLQVPRRRGTAAYDLLAQQPLEIMLADGPHADREQAIDLDLRRLQGAIVAFTPEPVAKLETSLAWKADTGHLRLEGELRGVSGKPIKGVFPVRITLRQSGTAREFDRVLGADTAAEFTLPQGSADRDTTIEVREALTGRTASHTLVVPARPASPIQLASPQAVAIPYPAEVARFIESKKASKQAVTIAVARSVAGADAVASDLVRKLKDRGIAARVAPEASVYRRPAGDPKAEDPLGDGFHTWRGLQPLIGPGLAVDAPLVVLGAARGSLLIDALAEHGYLSHRPLGQPGEACRPSVQVATKGLHFAHDTLCLIANDAAGMQAAVDALFAAAAPAAAPPVAEAGEPQAAAVEHTAADTGATAAVPVTTKMGTNEMIEHLKFDAAGNLYLGTWGHGNNFYSLDKNGAVRFARRLPEMGIRRLEVAEDRVLAYTAAGARLYQFTHDNKPLSQARINLDPGGTLADDDYALSDADFLWLPGPRRLLHNLGDRFRLLDEQGTIIAEWEGEAYEDKDVADKTLRRQLHGYSLSPDGSRIAQLESSQYFTRKGYEDAVVYDVHLVVRDLRGGLLHEFKEIDNGNEVTATVAWPADTAGPVVYAPNAMLAEGHERWLFDPALKLLAKVPYRQGMLSLGVERRLVRDGAMLLYYDTADRLVCRIGPFAIAPTFAAVSRDGSHLATLDEYGRLQIFATVNGRRRTDTMVPELGSAIAFTPDGSQLVLGGARGTVLSLDLDGKPVWRQELSQSNPALGGDLPERDPSFPDLTARLWPETRDEPGQLDKLVRLGPNRLVNGDAEDQTGWQGERIDYRGPGHESSRGLAVGPAPVTQHVSGYLGTHATWVLEFFYRAADAQTPVELLAGLMGDGRFRESTAVRLSADAQWRFARVAYKNGEKCGTLTVGFSAAAPGGCLVDRVSLRQIRFPSINHVLSEPLYPITPIVLENPLYSQQYDPVGNLREQAVNRVLIPPLRTGSLNLVENAWMQNGRLNDTSEHWYIQPFSRDSVELPMSMAFREPRWISMLAVYFNQRRPDQVAPHFDVYGVDPETGKDRLLASVRNNAQAFRLVKFPPIKTTLVKLVLVNSIERHRTVSEIELYGPLSGREGQPAFLDPEGQNTYMGDFTRVDKRLKSLADDYLPPLVRGLVHDETVAWHAPITQPLLAEGRMYLGRTFGQNTSHTLAEPLKDVSMGRAGGFGYTPYGTLYAGLILRTGNDGKLYCLNPDSGTELWSAALGSRLFGCPVCIGEDIYVANDLGKLFQLDLASGQIMKEAPIGGLVLGSLATDGRTLVFITDDGRLSAVDSATFKTLWQLPIAAATDSTPAVDQGTVYLADQQGLAQAVDLATGRPRWATPLEDEFARCPVVGANVVVYGCRGGTLAALDRVTGRILWKQQVESRFEYEPLLTENGLLFFSGGTAMLARLDTGESTPWQPMAASRGRPALLSPPFTLPNDPVVPLSYYRGRLAFIERPADKGHPAFQINSAWHLFGGSYTVLAPVEKAAVEAKP